MRITRFNNLYQLTLWPKFFPVNCYIIEESDHLTLIDTGMSASFKGIVEMIKKLDKPLRNIVLTHAHGDHVGSLEKLKVKFPEAIISISIRDNRLLQGDKSLDEGEPKTPIKGGVPKSFTIKPDKLLKEGDTISSLEVVETPGHTPGSISLFDKNQKAIIVGDALQTQGKTAVSGQLVPLFPFPTFGTWNKEVALNSAKKIQRLSPSLLAAGHGRVILDPDMMDRAVVVAEANINKK